MRVQEVGAAALTGERLRSADAVVFAITTGDLPVDRRALARFVRRGGGLAGFHSATDTFPSWPRWETLIGGRFVRTTRPAPWRPSASRARGIPPWTACPSGSASPRSSTCTRPASRGGRGCSPAGVAERRPLVWVRSPGRGRVFYDALGHIGATWSDPRHEALVRSGLRWVLRLP